MAETETVAPTFEDESIVYPSLLEEGERPKSVDEAEHLPLFRRLSKEEALEYGAEIAADMETGFYVPEGETVPWPKRRFVIKEILRRMGYSPSYVARNRRPRWWPDGGTQAFRGYVEWKVRERATLGRITYDKLVPYIEALTFMGFSEMARRIKLDPEHVPFRDLSQFTMRGAELIKAQGNPFDGEMTEAGADAYEKIGRALEGVGDDTARKAIAGLLDAVLVEARTRTRKVVEIPARAQ